MGPWDSSCIERQNDREELGLRTKIWHQYEISVAE
jgi:hypothetical protein